MFEVISARKRGKKQTRLLFNSRQLVFKFDHVSLTDAKSHLLQWYKSLLKYGENVDKY